MMDILCFLIGGYSFIPDYYTSASFSFNEQKGKLEAREELFGPAYSEGRESCFLTERVEAEDVRYQQK